MSSKEITEKVQRLVKATTPSNTPNGLEVSILYTNWKNEESWRRIIPNAIFFGETEWHKEPQWILIAYDYDKQAHRSFAIKDIKAWTAIDQASK